MRTLKIVIAFAFCLLALTPILSSKISGPKEALAMSSELEPGLPPSDPGDYIGSAACADCHGDQATHLANTAHRKLTNKSASVDKQGCEACHGGAKKHVEYQKGIQTLIAEGKDAESQALMADEAKASAAKMRSFSQLSPTESTKVCLQCHENQQGKSEERFNYRRSEHGRHGVACIDCHSSHSPKKTEFLLKEDEPEGCYKCHADQKASFARPFHHKVPEGGMKCSDCHNQHGSFQAKQLRGWQGGGETGCVKCHADKAGPFVYEHAPVKVEGCQSCHTPHGSTNARMLKRNEVKFLCLECHSNTPGIPDTEGSVQVPHSLTTARYQNCTVCHMAIHGSNSHSLYFRP
jgi:DmsE family decaheme c-type cytochrome